MTRRIFYSRERDLPRFHRFEDALKPLVQKWCWSRSVSDADNARARSDLVRFIETAKSLMKKAIRYDLDPLDPLADGMGYLRRMMILRESLQRQRYDLACHDLYDVVHYDRIEDRRVLYTIIALLEENL